MPANTILVPGILACGLRIYSLKVASFHTIAEFLLASEKLKFAAVPAWRPSSPLSSGPTLFSAPGPTAWQGRHLKKERWPFSTSCAAAFCNIAKLAVAAINAATARKVRVIPVFPLFARCAADANGCGADVCRPVLKRAQRSLSTPRGTIDRHCMAVLSRPKVSPGHAPLAAA